MIIVFKKWCTQFPSVPPNGRESQKTGSVDCWLENPPTQVKVKFMAPSNFPSDVQVDWVSIYILSGTDNSSFPLEKSKQKYQREVAFMGQKQDWMSGTLLFICKSNKKKGKISA